MARKHTHPKIHYGSRWETSCGLKFPRLGNGATFSRERVTCLGCLSVLARVEAHEQRGDNNAMQQYRLAISEFRLAMGAGLLPAPRRIGHLQGVAAVPLR